MIKATREAYGEELAELVKSNKKIVVLDADLAGSTKSILAEGIAPERFIDLGIAEGNMVGVAAGLAASNYIPFASSFAMFAAGRAWEQVRNSIAYPHLNVKIIGSHAGVTVGEDGASHQALEDIACMRVMPGMTVLVPADASETKACVDFMADYTGPVYLRTGRAKVDDVYFERPEVTKVNVVKKGNGKIAVFACGVEVSEALKAADEKWTVADVCSIKPVDTAGVVDVLRTHEIIFTAEEHNIIGGLGDTIMEIAAEYCPKAIHRIGVKDRFGQSGSASELLHEYGLDAYGISRQVGEYTK